MTRTSVLIVIVALLGIPGCKKGKNNPDACNGKNTRRSIKLATDTKADQINLTPIVTNVDSIGGIDVPDIDKESDRQSIEMKTFTITAEVHKLSKHRDGDWKVKLTDGNDKYVNCESPNMGCEYAAASLFFDQMQKARAWIQEREDELEGQTVTVTGVAFIDIDHNYPRNAADNNIELHPIIAIDY